jgi:hypothetical protein
MATAPHAISMQAPIATSDLRGEFHSREELALELGISPRTVARWEVLRTGPPITRIGRQVLYRKSSVRVWLAAQESQPVRTSRLRKRARKSER